MQPDATAMQPLKMLSAYLQKTASEGEIPDEGELAELKASVRELIDDVASGDLPPEVKRPLLHRLAEMLEALKHLTIGGPNAVRRAAESLAASVVIYGEGTDDPETVHKIAAFAKKAWSIFTVTTALANAVLTWDRLVELTPLKPRSRPACTSSRFTGREGCGQPDCQRPIRGTGAVASWRSSQTATNGNPGRP